MNWYKRVPWFYILFTIFPLLSLWAVNAAEVDPSVIVRPLLITLAGSAVLFLVLWVIFRQIDKAAFIGTLILFLFFSYGHVYDLLRHSTALSNLGRHRVLIPLYIAMLSLGIWGILSHVKKLKKISEWLNIVGILLILFSSAQLGYFYISTTLVVRRQASVQSSATLRVNHPDMPDVYFIVLDTYMRADALQEEMDYDNSAFINQLDKLGFYVARCSRPNYGFTRASIATTLNMNYLSALEAQYGVTEDDNGFWALIKNSEVRRQLQSIGYKTVSFRSEYPWLELTDADVFLGLDRPTIGSQYLFPFENLYIRTTAGVLLIAADSRLNVSSLLQANPREQISATTATVADPFLRFHIDLELFTLAKLPEIPAIAGPKFVYAHILIPHGPYVFGPDGEILTDPGYTNNDSSVASGSAFDRQGYVDGVRFINMRIIPILQSIIAESKYPPIIVLEGDHGYQDNNPGQYTNLEAYYLPRGYETLYPSITPVNSFRIIFDQYFGAHYTLLPDITDNNGVSPETYPDCKP
jgi:hypothetical protein